MARISLAQWTLPRTVQASINHLAHTGAHLNGRLIHVIGVPFNSAGTTDGVARAPAALRRAGLVAELRSTGADIDDCGDLDLVRPLPHAIRPPASSPRLSSLK